MHFRRNLEVYRAKGPTQPFYQTCFVHPIFLKKYQRLYAPPFVSLLLKEENARGGRNSLEAPNGD